MTQRPKPFALIILDGWGTASDNPYNAITAAKTPNWDRLIKNHTHTLLTTSGTAVGLPKGQMGNSEVGHLNLGAGRTVYQDLVRINKAIESEEFYANKVFHHAIDTAIKNDSALHIIGLLSPGGIHSQQDHLVALVKLAASKKLQKVYIHAILDGRDMPPKSAIDCITDFEQKCQQIGAGKIVSVSGRYYAMDRDKRWDRTELAYKLMVEGESPYYATNAVDAVKMAYERDESDEFIKPTSIRTAGAAPITIKNGDCVTFMNFRADRARQLCYALTEPKFLDFTRKHFVTIADFITLTEYDSALAAHVAFPPLSIKNGLGETLEKNHLTQLRIAETEKYAHVTFFFNGGIEKPYENEERLLVSSPKVATYDLQPEMSAPELTDKLVNAIQCKKYDAIICNYANPDMVGHTGNFDAAVKAIECVDTCLGEIADALEAVGGEALVTADHGNAECMFNETNNQAHTAHTLEPVPLLLIGKNKKIVVPDGTLADVAPTMLHLMGLEIPKDMTGRVLFD